MLTQESPLRRVFPTGLVPISSPVARTALLGEKPVGAERIFFIVLTACTLGQKEAMAAMMHEMGQGSIEEARKVVWTDDTLPVRETNFNGVSFPLRYVI